MVEKYELKLEKRKKQNRNFDTKSKMAQVGEAFSELMSAISSQVSELKGLSMLRNAGDPHF